MTADSRIQGSMQRRIKPDRQRIAEAVYCLFLFAFFLLWALQKDMYYAPDEIMRYQVCKYIFQHGTLPNGWLEEVRDPMWGFSYAFRPTMLASILQAGCMKLVSFVHPTEYSLMVAARLPSVMSGALSAFVYFRIGEQLFDDKTKWLMTVFITTIPQYAFLSSYINNDMLCVLGTAIICLAWARVLNSGWTVKTSLILCLGIIIVALTYYNGYGWILLSVFFFFGTYLLKQTPGFDRKTMLKMLGLICCVVLVCVSGFFIRNMILYEGDLFGMRSISESGEMYALDFLKPSVHQSPKEMGWTLWEMFSYDDWKWVRTTRVSFIGTFGQLRYPVEYWVYLSYRILFLAGGIGFALMIAEKVIRGSNFLMEKGIGGKNEILFYAMICFAILIPVALAIYYSYTSDFQAQGRYCYPALTGIAAIWGTGIRELRRLFAKVPVLSSPAGRRVISLVMVGAMLIFFCYMLIFSYTGVYLTANY